MRLADTRLEAELMTLLSEIERIAPAKLAYVKSFIYGLYDGIKKPGKEVKLNPAASAENVYPLFKNRAP